MTPRRIELPRAGRIEVTEEADGTRRRGGPRVMWKALESFRYADEDGEHDVEAGKTFVAPGHPLTLKWPERFLPVNMREHRKAAQARRRPVGARHPEAQRLREISGPPRGLREATRSPRPRWRLPGGPSDEVPWRLP